MGVRAVIGIAPVAVFLLLEECYGIQNIRKNRA